MNNGSPTRRRVIRGLAVTWLILSYVATTAGCCASSSSPDFSEKFSAIEKLMTQAEVTQALGPPAIKRTANFPTGQFMGPQAGMIGVIAPGQAYEEWEYTNGGQVFLIFFSGSHPDDPPNQWNVVGKMQYPQGAVF